jgi:hypothetical protein
MSRVQATRVELCEQSAGMLETPAPRPCGHAELAERCMTGARVRVLSVALEQEAVTASTTRKPSKTWRIGDSWSAFPVPHAASDLPWTVRERYDGSLR